MLKLATILGARPQFVKAAPVSKACAAGGIDEALIHTGQHYDAEMSEVFFRELDIPAPKYNLGIGGGGHGQMTGRMLEGLEKILTEDRPDWVLVYGDTNSTLAGALAATKLHIPVCHVEAGLRSWNRRMPEEVNRVLTDHIAGKLYCSSEVSVENLAREGITKGVEMVGDVMADASRLALGIIEGRAAEFLTGIDSAVLEEKFGLLTLHRAENTDDPERFRILVEQLNMIEMPLVFPVHPRTRQALERDGLELASHVKQVGPVGYLEMAALLGSASLVLTDSGGLQKEAYWAKVPCVTLRTETEWVETAECGWNVILGEEAGELKKIVDSFQPSTPWAPLYGDGKAAERIVASLTA